MKQADKPRFRVHIKHVIPPGLRWRPADAVLFSDDYRVGPTEETLGYGPMRREGGVQ